MLKSLQAFFERSISTGSEAPEDSEHQLRIATAALFIEMTRADFETLDLETKAVLSSLQRALEIDEKTAQEVMTLATAEADEAVELFQFTRLIDSSFSLPQKIDLVERLWAVALADDHIDEREEYLVRKVANLLHVSHREFIAAKKRAKAERA